MPQYDIELSFRGSLIMNIEAESESDALDKALHVGASMQLTGIGDGNQDAELIEWSTCDHIVR